MSDVWWRSRQASIPAIPPPVHAREEVKEWCRSLVVGDRETWVAEAMGHGAGANASDAANAVVAMLVLDGEWIDQLYVDPGYTGRGLGARLVDLAKQRRPTGLQLWTFESNSGARRFYERNGFAQTGRTDGDNEEGAPDIRYQWSGTT